MAPPPAVMDQPSAASVPRVGDKRVREQTEFTEAQLKALARRHHSFSDFTIDDDAREKTFKDISSFQDKETAALNAELAKGEDSLICGTQMGCIPVYDALSLEKRRQTGSEAAQEVDRFVYDHFYKGAGVLIVRNAYDAATMDKYNDWCVDYIRDFGDRDPNCRHPKQKGKYLINEFIPRMSASDPDTCLAMVGNEHYLRFCDTLLGFMKFGACTAHWISAQTDRQLSHVDYPMHVGSSPFWEASIEKAMRLTTRHQMNDTLKHYSVQVLIASDKMNVQNGSTEVVPCTHRLDDIDLLIHDPKVYERFEPMFQNVDLQQGDFLIFCRRLMHRGGKNLSDARRNSLITQNVWMWGVGQEIMDGKDCFEKLKASKKWEEMSEEQKEVFELRVNPPFPRDTKQST